MSIAWRSQRKRSSSFLSIIQRSANDHWECFTYTRTSLSKWSKVSFSSLTHLVCCFVKNYYEIGMNVLYHLISYRIVLRDTCLERLLRLTGNKHHAIRNRAVDVTKELYHKGKCKESIEVNFLLFRMISALIESVLLLEICLQVFKSVVRIRLLFLLFFVKYVLSALFSRLISSFFSIFVAPWLDSQHSAPKNCKVSSDIFFPDKDATWYLPSSICFD